MSFDVNVCVIAVSLKKEVLLNMFCDLEMMLLTSSRSSSISYSIFVLKWQFIIWEHMHAHILVLWLLFLSEQLVAVIIVGKHLICTFKHTACTAHTHLNATHRLTTDKIRDIHKYLVNNVKRKDGDMSMSSIWYFKLSYSN